MTSSEKCPKCDALLPCYCWAKHVEIKPRTFDRTGNAIPQPTPREDILDTAIRLTTGDRNATHGDPIPNMELFEYLAKPIYEAKDMPPAVKGALLNVAHKLARLIHNPKHQDSFIDLAAYAAIAGEAAIRSNHAEG